VIFTSSTNCLTNRKNRTRLYCDFSSFYIIKLLDKRPKFYCVISPCRLTQSLSQEPLSLNTKLKLNLVQYRKLPEG
jgi:hypothetical protein